MKMQRKWNPSAFMVGMIIGAATVESNMEVPQKVKTELPCHPASPLLDIYLRK